MRNQTNCTMAHFRKIYLFIAPVVALLLGGPLWGESAAQTPDSLSHYLEAAARDNPGVKADFLDYRAALQKIAQAGAYPDPELEIGMFLEPMEIIGGKQVAEFKLMQMFPWFGTKRAAESEATHMAKMAFEKFRETRDNLFLEVSTQWYLLCNLQQKLLNYQENRLLLGRLEQLALQRFSSPSGASAGGSARSSPAQPSARATSGNGGMSSMGSMESNEGSQPTARTVGTPSMGGTGSEMSGSMSSGSSGGMSNVLRIQLEIAGLDNRIESVGSQLKAEKARFNALLNRRPENHITVPDSFHQVVLHFDPDSIMSQIGNRSPMLAMLQEEEGVYQSKAEMDKKMGYPMFGVGIQYMVNRETTNPMFAMDNMNGKDMLMPMLSLSIPVVRDKYRARKRESLYLWQAARSRYTQTYNALAAEWHKTRHLLDDAMRKVALYTKQSELAQTTANLTVQEFITGKSTLSDVILIHRQLLEFQLNQAEAVAEYNTMAATVKKLLSFSDTEQNVNHLNYENR